MPCVVDKRRECCILEREKNDVSNFFLESFFMVLCRCMIFLYFSHYNCRGSPPPIGTDRRLCMGYRVVKAIRRNLRSADGISDTFASPCFCGNRTKDTAAKVIIDHEANRCQRVVELSNDPFAVKHPKIITECYRRGRQRSE